MKFNYEIELVFGGAGTEKKGGMKVARKARRIPSKQGGPTQSNKNYFKQKKKKFFNLQLSFIELFNGFLFFSPQ